MSKNILKSKMPVPAHAEEKKIMKTKSISPISTHVVKPIMATTAAFATMFLLAACGNKTNAIYS